MHTPFARQLPFISLLYIGLILISLKVFAADNKDASSDIYDDQVTAMADTEPKSEDVVRVPAQSVDVDDLEDAIEDERPPLVEVEPSNILPGDIATNTALVPYKVRRNDWGSHWGLSYSLFEPVNFQSDSISPTLADFEELFGGADSALLELLITIKYNFSFGAIAMDTRVGTYAASADQVSTSELSLTIISLGARLILDAMFFEPYIAPYVSMGLYTVLYNEEYSASTFEGNTLPAIYYTAGALFQLDWLDAASATESYLEAGIENTFVFVEARQFLASSEAQDPDFGTPMHFNAGFVIEF